MNGNYLGKSYSGILEIFDIMEVPIEDRRTMFDLIGDIDKYRAEAIRKNKPKESPKA